MCRQGASAIQTKVLDTITEPELRVYVAWVPILPDDSGSAANESSALVTDSRVSQFWDESKALPGPFAKILELPDGWPAWDVYLAYPPGARWDDGPPKPAFWHHQLPGLSIAPTLDAERFAQQLRELLATNT